MKKILVLSLGCASLLFSDISKADLVGIWGDGGHFSSPLINAGHEYVAIGPSSTLADLSALDQVWLIRQEGYQALIDYVNNGGTLITEWNAADWALNSASLLDVTDSFGFSQQTSVLFTDPGLELGFGKSLPNPYFNGSNTQFFRSFTNIGNDVDVIATSNGYNVGVAGSYGDGSVISLGWDWQDDKGVNDITQALVDDIVGTSSYNFYNKNLSDVPTPVALSSLALIGLLFRKRLDNK